MFNLRCLHIPPSDRTSFTELVKLVEGTVKSEYQHAPERPIYLVGESLGACLALAVAAHNPEIDLVLVLVNSGTSFTKSQLRLLLPLLESMPKELGLGIGYMLNFITGIASAVAEETWVNRLPLQQTDSFLPQPLVALSSYLPGLTEVFSTDTLLWKLRMLDSACSYTNPRLHSVKAQTLILCSGRDLLFPSRQEGQRLHTLLPNSDIRMFNESGHMLFMEEDHDLVPIIIAASFYRRSRKIDYVLDYLPPTPSEFRKAREAFRTFRCREVFLLQLLL